MYGLLFFLALFAGILLGWYSAHLTIATECERLGGFYAGGTVYKCVAVLRKNNKQEAL